MDRWIIYKLMGLFREKDNILNNNYNWFKVIDVIFIGIFMMNFFLLVNWLGRVFEEGE